MARPTLLKWLSPGIGLKRWMALAAAGLACFWVSAVVWMHGNQPAGGVALMGAGLVLMGLGAFGFSRALIRFLNPRQEGATLVARALDSHHLKKGLKIVALGGGTGLSTLLSGLKAHTSNLTAIVTVTDEGGSSGRLRKDYNLLPPGDIRQCLAALSDAPPLMAQLFQYRFDGVSDISQHSFGNLFILAMTKLTGDFELALKESSRILAIRGQVLPSTLTDVRLVAETADGRTLEGELAVSMNRGTIRSVRLSPEKVEPASESIRAIHEADAVILGPGSLYTSVIPNLLVEPIRRAILESSAYKIYVGNVMTQQGETEGFTLADHLDKLIAHSSRGIVDCVVANTRVDCIPESLLRKYRLENAQPVLADRDRILEQGYRFMGADIISISHFVRHDPYKLADVIVGAIEARNAPRQEALFVN